MSIHLPDARQLPDVVLEALRLRAVRACELGFTHADIADMLGLARETVSRWWEAYQRDGRDGLPDQRTGRPVGSGRLLSDEQAEHIQAFIDAYTPEQLGLASPLWNRRAVADLIANEYDLRLPVRTVGEYLKRWGYTAKKPRRQARDQDPDEVLSWLEETYPHIEQQAEQEQATILWTDEAGVEADTWAGYGYAPKGQPAVLQVPPSHIRVNLISALSNTGLLRFMTYKGSMNGALFVVFLERLLRSVEGKILLIADRLKAHDAQRVQDWLAQHKEQMEIFWLPKYSPELDVVEYLNNDMKTNVKAEGLPHTWTQLRTLMQRFMHRIQQLPKHVMNYFLNPWVSYAAVG
jgi:transposase